MAFDSNRAQMGGATYFSNDSYIIFDDYTLTKFSNNTIVFGGSLFVGSNGIASFKGDSMTLYILLTKQIMVDQLC